MHNISTTIRKENRSIREEFSKTNEYKKHSLLAQENILSSAIWQESKNIALYLPFRGEVETNILIEKAYLEAKKLYFPKCLDKTKGEMKFYAIEENNFSHSFSSGAYGILEPNKDLLPTKLPEKSLVILPCLAYTTNGYRLGYGGGYYDRLLAKNKLSPFYTAIVLAFSFQENTQIKPQAWDMPVQYIAHEKELICCHT